MPVRLDRTIPFVPTGAQGDAHALAYFRRHVDQLLNMVGGANEVGRVNFAGDGMITMLKSVGFLEDEAFVGAINASEPTDMELTRIWRSHTLVWAARQALASDGDFVELGTYTGHGAFVVREATRPGDHGKRFWLFDLFDRALIDNPEKLMPAHGPDLHARVVARFADMEEVTVVQGEVPEVLQAHAPEAIAYMHVDLNDATAERGALELLFDRVSPGGVLVFDDYGWSPYRPQLDMVNAFMRARNQPVLEMPTGQGVVVKRV